MSEEEDRGVVGKVVLTGVVLVLSPFVEIVTGAAPIGTVGALGAIALIWGFEDVVDEATE